MVENSGESLKRTLTVSDVFYITSKLGKLNLDEIADDIGCHVDRIHRWLRENPEVHMNTAPLPANKVEDGWTPPKPFMDNGCAIMTPDASSIGDKSGPDTSTKHLVEPPPDTPRFDPKKVHIIKRG